jgi:hypothetical protein
MALPPSSSSSKPRSPLPMLPPTTNQSIREGHFL